MLPPLAERHSLAAAGAAVTVNPEKPTCPLRRLRYLIRGLPLTAVLGRANVALPSPQVTEKFTHLGDANQLFFAVIASSAVWPVAVRFVV